MPSLARFARFARFACSVRVGVVAALCASPSAWSAPLSVLDQPAQASRLAAVSPITAVALAGDHFVAVGPRGHVLVSGLQEIHWQQVAVPSRADLTAVHFVSASRGWAVGHGATILHTQDGGHTWVRQLDGREGARQMVAFYQQAVDKGEPGLRPLLEEAQRMVADGPGRPLLSVWFRDAQNGFAVGAFNLILRTQDGGKSWAPWLHRTDNPRMLHLTSVTGDARNVYIVGEQGLLLRLDDSAQRFVAMPSPYKGSFFGCLIPEPGSLLVFGMRGSAYFTRDGGAQWAHIETGDPSALTGGTLLGSGQSALVTQSGKVLLYRAGQSRVEALPASPPMPYAGVAAAADGMLALVGFGGVRAAAVSAARGEPNKGAAR